MNMYLGRLLKAHKLLRFNAPSKFLTNKILLKSVTSNVLIYEIIKEIGYILFYIWDWISLFIIITIIIVCIIILFDINILHYLGLQFPLIKLAFMNIASNLNIIEESNSWTDFFNNIYFNIKNYSIDFFYQTLALTYWSVYNLTYSGYILFIYYPLYSVYWTFSNIKSIIAFITLSSIFYVGTNIYFMFDQIVQTAINLPTIVPNLPNIFYLIIASIHHIILAPIEDFYRTVAINHYNLFQSLVLLIPTEREVLNFLIRTIAMGQILIDNYTIPGLFEFTNVPEHPRLQLIIKTLFIPVFFYASTISYGVGTILNWLTRL